MKKRIILSIGALLLLLSVVTSVAWLSNFDKKKVTSVNVDYQNGMMTIADMNFDAWALVPDGSGSYRKLGDNEEFTFNSRSLVPDSVTPFKIEIENKTESEKTANLSLIFTTDDDDTTLREHFYIDVVIGNKYHVYRCLAEASEIGNVGSGIYVLDIYGEGAEINISASSIITLDCYFYYDKFADASNQAKNINIQFRLE
jgi:hypothetical protein